MWLSRIFLSTPFSCSDEAVATVNTATGEVSIVGVGDTTITAAKAENATFAQATANYTLENCYSPAVVTGDNADDTGGIVGRNQSEGQIKNCYSTGVISGRHTVGGSGKEWATSYRMEHTEIESDVIKEEIISATQDGEQVDLKRVNCDYIYFEDATGLYSRKIIVYPLELAEQRIKYPLNPKFPRLL